MRFYQQQRRFYCGIDLHAKQMFVCVLNDAGEIVLHRNIPATCSGPVSRPAHAMDRRSPASANRFATRPRLASWRPAVGGVVRSGDRATTGAMVPPPREPALCDSS